MSADAAPITVRILEKEFRVACPASERDDLLASARMLDARMREIRDSRKVVGMDRIAVICALNLAHELLQTRNKMGYAGGEEVAARLKSLQDRIESALQKNSQHDL